MWKSIAIVVLALLVIAGGLLLFAATKPDTFQVQRTATIKAPPEKIFAFIGDFHHWGVWSPYEKLDPAMRRTLSGAAEGKGSIYEWDSDGRAGRGRMEITDAFPPSQVTIKLDFVKPFESHNTVDFSLQPQGESTNVTWAMQGPNPYIAKVMSIFVSMDSLVGKDFENGLANLKTLAEGGQ
jgi:uncharacterized protein YndB with AHSA1/START domain